MTQCSLLELACSMLVGKTKHESECGKKKSRGRRKKRAGERFSVLSLRSHRTFLWRKSENCGKIRLGSCVFSLHSRRQKEAEEGEKGQRIGKMRYRLFSSRVFSQAFLPSFWALA